MIRHQHFLKPNKSVQLPHNCVYVDTETKPRRTSRVEVQHDLWFGWACHERTYAAGKWTETTWKRFTKDREFWSWVEGHTRPKTRLYVFAHNWAFDALVLHAFHILPELGWSLSGAVIESPPVILTWRKGDRVIEMLDTLNWWRMSLDSLGKSVGSPKLKMPERSAGMRTWNRYCRNDVEVIRRALRAWWGFIERYDLGGFARTLAGQSMRAYRHRFMKHDILIDNNVPATELARSSYHGGRTECFRLGKLLGPIHVLDVNSMYPAVMQDRPYPTILRLYARNGTLREIKRWTQDHCVVARVDLETSSAQYAHQSGDKLLFPVGRFRAVLTTPDLVAALSQGHIKRVHDVAVYERANIFSDFVHAIYSLRREAATAGDDVNSFMLKILMNSLYGKFAQRGIVWNPIGEAKDNDVRQWREIDFDSGEVRSYRQFSGVVQQLDRDPEAYSSHPAIASHVTAYARRLLWDLMNLAGRENVFYCDTDSLYVNDVGNARLAGKIDPATLGLLKHETSHEWIVIHGPKDYHTPAHRKTKGVRASATWLTPNTVTQEQWSSLSGALQRTQLAAPTTTTVVKVLRRTYGKGTVSPSGRVSPLRLSEW